MPRIVVFLVMIAIIGFASFCCSFLMLTSNISINTITITNTNISHLNGKDHLNYSSILNDTERIKYYMGKWYTNGVEFINDTWRRFTQKHQIPVFNNQKTSQLQYISKYSVFNDTKNHQLRLSPKHYVFPFLRFLNLSKLSNNFQCRNYYLEALVAIFDLFDDSNHEMYKTIPVFAKARYINASNDSAILIQELNYGRHWAWACKLYNKIIQPDIEWNKKMNVIIWRGVSTGGIKRISFVRQYINYSNYANYSNVIIDVGFTKLVQYPKKIIQELKLKHLVKKKISKDELLKYKYLVSFEGNDVASNLKWLLMSNSVVFMPTPTKETWLMEGLLKPYIHYIPLNFNKTTLQWDLEEKYKFCLENDDFCHQIAQNSQQFMIKNKFCDINHRMKLQTEMLHIYCLNNKLTFN